jgi:cation diffusion facilitator CzcD-associated flavoprotein CzcO
MQDFDVVIVGAGISGIGTACHLQRECSETTYCILEGGDSIGGTWNLFKYPGVRSDSDMYTLCYNFKPWTNSKAIADGELIMEYLQETVDENNLTPHIRFNCRVVSASWSTETSTWAIMIMNSETGEESNLTCNFLSMCSGYYNYQKGHTPEFEGTTQFKGTIVHPQEWPQDLNYQDKKVVVIGSGATAMTLVPALAQTGANHVTMVQVRIQDNLRSLHPALDDSNIFTFRHYSVLLHMSFRLLLKTKWQIRCARSYHRSWHIASLERRM